MITRPNVVILAIQTLYVKLSATYLISDTSLYSKPYKLPYSPHNNRYLVTVGRMRQPVTDLISSGASFQPKGVARGVSRLPGPPPSPINNMNIYNISRTINIWIYQNFSQFLSIQYHLSLALQYIHDYL